MTTEEHIKFIEGKIQQCIDVQDMEMEKWAFIQCLKNARKLGQELPIHSVSNSVKIALLKQLEELSDRIPAEIYTRKVIEIKEQFL